MSITVNVNNTIDKFLEEHISQFFSMLNLYLLNGVQLSPRRTALDDRWNSVKSNAVNIKDAFIAMRNVVFDNIDSILIMISKMNICVHLRIYILQ